MAYEIQYSIDNSGDVNAMGATEGKKGEQVRFIPPSKETFTVYVCNAQGQQTSELFGAVSFDPATNPIQTIQADPENNTTFTLTTCSDTPPNCGTPDGQRLRKNGTLIVKPAAGPER